MFTTVEEYSMFSGPAEEEGAGSDAFQDPVLDIVALLPAPAISTDGDRYILTWDNNIYELINGAWEGTTPEEGWLLYANKKAGVAVDEYYTYVSVATGWVIAPKHLIHGLDDFTVHTAPTPAVENNILTFNANGLPKDSGVAISAIGALPVVTLTGASVAFNILATHDFIGVETNTAAGHVTLNLPTADTVGKYFTIADVGINAAVNNIIITPDGADTIDTVAAAVTYTVNSTVIIMFCYASGKWKVT